MLSVNWVKCNGGNWCSFKRVDLKKVTAKGVYAIGYKSSTTDAILTVYVGQGDVAERVEEHRSGNTATSKKILGYATEGTMVVTWAAINAEIRDGVEKYLADELEPIVGHTHPDVDAIPVSKPAKWK